MKFRMVQDPPEEQFVVRVPWGTFGNKGTWFHNPALRIDAAEQCRQNNTNGYRCQLPQPEEPAP